MAQTADVSAKTDHELANENAALRKQIDRLQLDLRNAKRREQVQSLQAEKDKVAVARYNTKGAAEANSNPSAQVWTGSAVAVSRAAASTYAADMPVKVPVEPIAAMNWTGWYVGLNAGGNWGRSKTSTVVDLGSGLGYTPASLAILNAAGQPTGFDTSGFIGGEQFGYNYQIGRWLLGVEGDFDYFHSVGSKTLISTPIAGNTATMATSVSTDWLFTLRPRVGVIASNWLFYATGGLAVTRLKAGGSFVETGTIPLSASASTSSNKAGWVIGGGIETLLPGRWTFGAEYLYVGFNNITATYTLTPLTNVSNQTVDLHTNIFRGRVSKFF